MASDPDDLIPDPTAFDIYFPVYLVAETALAAEHGLPWAFATAPADNDGGYFLPVLTDQDLAGRMIRHLDRPGLKVAKVIDPGTLLEYLRAFMDQGGTLVGFDAEHIPPATLRGRFMPVGEFVKVLEALIDAGRREPPRS